MRHKHLFACAMSARLHATTTTTTTHILNAAKNEGSFAVVLVSDGILNCQCCLQPQRNKAFINVSLQLSHSAHTTGAAVILSCDRFWKRCTEIAELETHNAFARSQCITGRACFGGFSRYCWGPYVPKY